MSARCALTLALVVFAPAARNCSGQLLDSEIKGLADALFVGNIAISELSVDRESGGSPFALDLAAKSARDPLGTANELMGLHARCAVPTSELLGIASRSVLGDASPVETARAEAAVKLPIEVPSELRGAISGLVGAVASANEAVRAAISRLTADEKRALVEGLPQWACPEARFEFVRSPARIPSDLLILLARIDEQAMRVAAERLTESIEGALGDLRRVAALSSFRGKLAFVASGVPVVLCGKGDDVHTERGAMLTIDLGGEDRYEGRHGAGAGYASLLLDLGGDDEYRVPDLSVGSGLVGIGIAFDLGGSDRFLGASLCFGAGLAGVGIFVKEGGDDEYRAASLSLGFAQFGVGIHRDSGGDDRYRSEAFSLGSARTRGVGWMIDLAGDDDYRSNGAALPTGGGSTGSFSQGFGGGFGEEAGTLPGGLGLLTEWSGNDSFVAGAHAQAASARMGVGSLLNAAGEDAYIARQNAQSSAMHGGASFLFELSGDDSYIVSFGGSHGQGHDGGIAFLLERLGNDVFAGRDSRPGSGSANGIGLFLDAQGEDRYFGPPGVGIPARGSGSLGVFADLNGSDVYAAGLSDGEVARGTVWGVAFDAETKLPRGSGPSGVRRTPSPGTVQRPSDAELESIFQRAARWPSPGTRSEIDAHRNQLIAIGMPALDWMIGNRLARSGAVEQRVFVEVVGGIGEPARKRIAARIEASNEAEALAALEICIEGGFQEAAPVLAGALKRPGLARSASRAARVLLAGEAVAELMSVASGSDRTIVLEAMSALAAIGDPQSAGTADALATSTSLPIRKAAIELLAKLSERGTQSGRLLLRETDERRARIGIEILAAVGTPEALEAIAPMLDDGRAGLRIEAMLALNGRCPPAYRKRMVELRRDPVPLVRAVATRIDLGR